MGNFWLLINPFVIETHESAIVAGIFFFAIIICPISIFLWIGWPWKRNDIFVMLTTKAKVRYFSTFQKRNVGNSIADEEFKKFYKQWYGRRVFLIPVLLIGFISFYLGNLIGETALFFFQQEQGVSNLHFSKLPLTAAAAVAGAFTFVSWDLTTRAARRNMSWNDVLLGALRLAICIPVGYAMAAFLAPALAPFVAFSVGVLPVDALVTVVERILNKTYKLEIGADSSSENSIDKVVKLSGVDTTIADRIYDADVTTIAQLAYCDPIQLAMRTNLGFAYILDGVSQALAWLYLGDKLTLIRSTGIRGAYEIKSLRDAIKSGRADSIKVAADISTMLNMSKQQLGNLLDQIADDPYTEFLVDVFAL